MADQLFTDEDIIRYAAGDLEETRAVLEHLERSVEARMMVARVRRVLETMATADASHPPAHVVERVLASFSASRRGERHRLLEGATQFVARLVFDRRQQPMLAGFRGGGVVGQLAYESENARVDLRLSPPADAGACEWRVKGQVTVQNGETSSGLVALLDAGDTDAAAETTLDDRGRFQLDSPAGSYDLLIELGEGVLVASGLQVG